MGLDARVWPTGRDNVDMGPAASLSSKTRRFGELFTSWAKIMSSCGCDGLVAMPRKMANYAIVACSVAALAFGWLARGHSQTTGQPPEATRHSFQNLQSGGLARPASTDSPDLEAWLTTTRDGLIHQRSTLARQKVSPSTVVFDAAISVETNPGMAWPAQAAGWPRLAEAWGSLGHDLELREAFSGGQLAQVSASLFSTKASMLHGADAARRRGLMYIGNAPLPARSTVALYRCLLIRSDAYAEMVRDGTVSAAFWRRYAIAMSWPPEPQQWHCLPAGDLPGEGGDWWRLGELSAAQIRQGREALRSQAPTYSTYSTHSTYSTYSAYSTHSSYSTYSAYSAYYAEPGHRRLEGEPHAGIVSRVNRVSRMSRRHRT